jgi:hypothetical protein
VPARGDGQILVPHQRGPGAGHFVGAGYDLSLMRYSLVLESVPLVFLP